MTSGLNGEWQGSGITGIDIPFSIDPASPICELHAATLMASRNQGPRKFNDDPLATPQTCEHSVHSEEKVNAKVAGIEQVFRMEMACSPEYYPSVLPPAGRCHASIAIKSLGLIIPFGPVLFLTFPGSNAAPASSSG